MAQLKIGHLRALPAPADDAAKRAALARLGATWSARNEGITAAEQAALDELVGDLLELDATERGLVATWAAGFVRAAGAKPKA